LVSGSTGVRGLTRGLVTLHVRCILQWSKTVVGGRPARRPLSGVSFSG